MTFDFHTADAAPIPHVVVFTVGRDGEQDQVAANFYPLRGEEINLVEIRAIRFMSVLEAEKGEN